mmetsp:Transcript_19929/g.56449  ORF Transcript_19929/g.56449 Transcript_19929/m.56449 type:complete len:672 (+) Transcript_19929:286-2301(+)
MKCNQFEIKVALLGYVSVGKSTVLNALLGKKFSEVSMKRTTAGINYFKIVNPKPDGNDDGDDPAASTKGNRSTASKASNERWYDASDEVAQDSIQTHSAILSKITKDNQELRASNKIQERLFNINVDTPIVAMRTDTNLVVVDIPGINEAGTAKIYKKHVADKWSTFDCAIVVMDALQGVNTDEQVNILKFVKENNTKHKDIPIIVVGNKVDNPDDEEQMELVEEVREKVTQVFGSGCRNAALEAIVRGKGTEHRVDENPFAAFVPISAMHAFVYRTASSLPLKDFEKLGMGLIDKIGLEEVSRFKWKKFNKKKKIQVAFDSIHNDDDYKERIAATNFDSLLSVLEYCLGGQEVQAKLIKKQIQVELARLVPTSIGAGELKNCFEDVLKKCKGVGISADTVIKPAFKSFYKVGQTLALAEFSLSVDIDMLGKCAMFLREYGELSADVGWQSECENVSRWMHLLNEKMFDVIIDKYGEWDLATWYGKCHPSNAWVKVSKSWASLSPKDWTTLLESVTLCMNEKYAVDSFGKQRVLFDDWKIQMSRLCDDRFSVRDEKACLTPVSGKCAYHGHSNCGCSYMPKPTPCGSCTNCVFNKTSQPMYNNVTAALKGTIKNREFVPSNKKVVCLKMPESPRDPTHFGHVVWEFCRYNDFMLLKQAGTPPFALSGCAML